MSGGDELRALACAGIDWTRCGHINYGGSAVIYRVGRGVVAKVSPHSMDEEVAVQRYFATLDKALPVLAYEPGCALPLRIREEACPMHGLDARQRSFDSLEEEGDHVDEGSGNDIRCTCSGALGILVMPQAEWPVPYTEEVGAFMQEIDLLCQQAFKRPWDARLANVALHGGCLVALDFGEISLPEVPRG